MRVVFILALTASAQAAPPSATAPLSDDDRSLLAEGEIADSTSSAAGLTGAFIGFGLGDAIIGHYSSTGWIFTLVDVAGLGAIGVGITHQPCEDAKCTLDPPFDHMLGVGVATLAISHFLQLVEVDRYTTRHNAELHALRVRQGYERPRVAPILAPRGDGMLAGVSVRF